MSYLIGSLTRRLETPMASEYYRKVGEKDLNYLKQLQLISNF
jgi:hypothetical protein